MNRRAFLQLAGLVPVSALLRLPLYTPLEEGGQFVFDGVNGLTFLAEPQLREIASSAGIVRFRRLSFIERLLEGFK